MSLTLWTLKDIMDLVDTRSLSVTLADLQKYQSDCEEKRRSLKAARANPLGNLNNTVTNGPEGVYLEQIISTLKQAEKVCTANKWRSADETIGLMNVHIKYQDDESDWSSFASDLRTAVGCIISAMWHSQFVSVLPEYSGYVNNEKLLDGKVFSAFPSARFDIKETGNCIAVGCGTAAVFHLMRVAEFGLRALCEHLHITRVRRSKKPKEKKYIPIAYTQWEKMLGAVHVKVDEKIDKMTPGKRKQDLQEFYYPLLQDLKGFKDAWRNHVMHSRKEYTPKEAAAILEHVRSFMDLLSTKVSETKDDISWLEEYEKFDQTMRKLMTVSHEEIKSKLEAEKKLKPRRNKKNSQQKDK